MGDSEAPAIVVVGSMNIDLIAYAARLPDRGETVMGERFAMGFGGKGANQAVMAARLGGSVLMVGGLGDDSYGELTLGNLASAGIDASGVQRFAGSSGVAPIWVEPDGSNRIIVGAGCERCCSIRSAPRRTCAGRRVWTWSWVSSRSSSA